MPPAPEPRPRPWLAPLGALFGAAASLRTALYRRGLLPQARLAGPVISVGNLSLGGTGKTPVVERLAQILRDEGLPVAILSRGYRGRFRGKALVVGDGERFLAEAHLAGDEPVMLARSLPGVVVAVGRRRDRVGRAVEARFGPRVHILDDGFQHLRLARDLDLLCLESSDLRDRPLPAGRLRELPRAAARAHLVLLTDADEAGAEAVAELERVLGPHRAFRVRRPAVGFFALDGGERPAPSRPFLLSGIARPERFEADVRSRVAGITGHARFPDHHAFTPEEIWDIEARALSGSADAIVTTAKDATRLPRGASDLPVLVFRVSAEIQDEARLRERLLAVVRRHAPRHRPARPRHALEDRATGLAVRICKVLPRIGVLALGRFLGRLLGDHDGRHVAIAVDNLRRAFPHWEEARLLRTARAVYAHFGQVLLDILWLDGRSREDVLALVEVEGREHVEAAMAAGRGAVLLTAHIGNWELHGVAHGHLFGPIGVVARPLDNPALDRRLCDVRTMGGNTVVYKQRALGQVVRMLREGKGVAILLDQNLQESEGIFVEFFGRPAATTTVAAALALKTGCALVPCRTALLPDGRYRLSYGPPVAWASTGDRQADVAGLTQKLTRIIEDWVRETPEQWLWIHRRWKTQPKETAGRVGMAASSPRPSKEPPAGAQTETA